MSEENFTEKDLLPSIHQSPSFTRLSAFEKVSWPREEQASDQALIERLGKFPEGIFLLKHNGEDIAQVTVVPKRIPEIKKIATLHDMRKVSVDVNSKDLWVANIARRQGAAYEKRGYVSQLLEEVIAWARHHGYRTIQTVVTCDGFSEKYKNRTFVSSNGESLSAEEAIIEYMKRDMNPAFNALRRAAAKQGVGIEVGAPIHGYWPENMSSAGYGVFVKIDLLHT